MLPPGRDSPVSCSPSLWPAAPSPRTPQWPRSQHSGMFGGWNARPGPSWWSFSPDHPCDPHHGVPGSPPSPAGSPSPVDRPPLPLPRGPPLAPPLPRPPGRLTPVTCPLLRDILLQPQPQLRGPVAFPGGPWLHQDEVGVVVVQGAEGALAASVVQGVVHGAVPLGTHTVRPGRGPHPQMEEGPLLLQGAPREGTLQTEPRVPGGGGLHSRGCLAFWGPVSGPRLGGAENTSQPQVTELAGLWLSQAFGHRSGWGPGKPGAHSRPVPAGSLAALSPLVSWEMLPPAGRSLGRSPRSLPPPSTPPGSGSSPPYPAVASGHCLCPLDQPHSLPGP